MGRSPDQPIFVIATLVVRSVSCELVEWKPPLEMLIKDNTSFLRSELTSHYSRGFPEAKLKVKIRTKMN